VFRRSSSGYALFKFSFQNCSTIGPRRRGADSAAGSCNDHCSLKAKLSEICERCGLKTTGIRSSTSPPASETYPVLHRLPKSFGQELQSGAAGHRRRQSDSSRSRKSSPTTSVLGSSSVTGTPIRLFQSSLRRRLLLEGSTGRAIIRPRFVIAICWPSNNIASIFGKEVRSSLTVTVLMLM